jgi:predicted nuclease of restriction endonuclease-like (RecB) superfamily
MNELHTNDYKQFVGEIKQAIQQAQMKAVIEVNHHLLSLYWNVGHMILDRQKKFGWGGKVIDQLSKDIKTDFPNIQGFSIRNLKYMRAFANEYQSDEFVQVPLAQITWYHNITLLEKVKDKETRIWYAFKTLENGWSRDVLVMQIESKLHARIGKAIHNFENFLPKPQSDLAEQTLKDPYIFDFVSLRENYLEKELEDALVKHVTNFLLELGVGFAYIGRQYQLL